MTLQNGLAWADNLVAGSVQLALSEIKREELPPPSGPVSPPLIPVDPAASSPTPVSPAPSESPDTAPPAAQPASPLDDIAPTPGSPATPEPDDTAADPARPNVDPNAPLPTVEYDLTKLPVAVLEMHT
ncbi:MAG: hypothetical protein ACRCU5_04420, partial [Rhizobiaceae bacterium]